MANNTLSVTDNRTGKKYELPIEEGDVIRAADLRQIKVGKDDFGLMSYDPAFTNTASCRSRITYIDGDKGILRYRGYPIEELAEKSNYLEVAYLIVKGELPDREHYERWENNIKIHTMVHENIKKFMEGYRYDAHPMGMLLGTVGALSTFYPDANDIHDLESRRLQTRRLIGKMPTLAAFAYRHTKGLPYVYPDNDLSYTGNLLSMLFKMTELQVQARPGARARTRRAVYSACRSRAKLLGQCDARGGQLAAGPVRMRGGGSCGALRSAAWRGERSCDPDADGNRIGVEYSRDDQEGEEGERRLMGFGHRVYKNYDPRAKILKEMAAKVFEVTGRNPLIDIAIELRAYRVAGRLLHLAQVVSQRRFLFRNHLPGDGISDDNVPGAVRDPTDLGLDGAVGRDGARFGAEDRAAAPDLRR